MYSCIFFLWSRSGLDMVVRDDNGNKLDINQTSTTQLYLQHREAVKRIKMATVGWKNNFSFNFKPFNVISVIIK